MKTRNVMHNSIMFTFQWSFRVWPYCGVALGDSAL